MTDEWAIPNLTEKEASDFINALIEGRESPTKVLIERVEAMIRLLEPDDITPAGARQLREVLRDE